MRPEAPTNRTAAERTGRIMHVLAVIILLGTIVWGVGLYPGMPAEIPIHWNAAGEADDFRPKSIGWVFGPLFIALTLVVGILVLHRVMGRSDLAVPSERQAYALTFGYVNLSMAVIFSWISVMGWMNLDLGPWLIAFALLAAVPVLIIMGLYLGRITAERKAMSAGTEPSMDPKYWVWGGIFYSNAKDPRTLVPRPPHTGVGTTFNLATPGGKLSVILLIVLIVGSLLLPILL